MVGRQLPFFSLIVPFWLIWAFAGFRGMIEIWPAILVAGVCFAVPQFLVSNLHGPWLVDVVAAIVSIASLALFLKFWQPKRIWRFEDGGRWSVVSGQENKEPNPKHEVNAEHTSKSAICSPQSEIFRVWLPWIILSIVVFIWELPQPKAVLDSLSAPKIPIYSLDKLVLCVPPLVVKPMKESADLNL